MNAKEIFNNLAELAPSVVFRASREADECFVWDGDGPDPWEEGYTPYNVTVEAMTIVGGVTVEGQSHLGGSYYKFDEPIDDVHGYLPQMLEEAAEELEGEPEIVEPVAGQLKAAIAFLRKELEDRYAEQHQPNV